MCTLWHGMSYSKHLALVDSMWSLTKLEMLGNSHNHMISSIQEATDSVPTINEPLVSKTIFMRLSGPKVQVLARMSSLLRTWCTFCKLEVSSKSEHNGSVRATRLVALQGTM